MKSSADAARILKSRRVSAETLGGTAESVNVNPTLHE